MNKFNLQKNKKKCSHVERIFSAQEVNKQRLCKPASPIDDNQEYGNREKLILKYNYLVKGVVSRLPVYGLRDMDRDDLIGYGTIGLIEAVDRFDPSRNVCFESFAVARIRGAVYDQLRASDLLSRGSRKRVKTLAKAVNKLENELNRYPTDEEISLEMEITLQDLRKIRQEAQVGVYSLDEKKDSTDENSSMLESISSNDCSIQDLMEERELIQALSKAIDCLPEKEKAVVSLYHYNKLTFKEIAHIMSFSESRASQVHAKAVSLLRDKMIKH